MYISVCFILGTLYTQRIENLGGGGCLELLKYVELRVAAAKHGLVLVFFAVIDVPNFQCICDG